MRTQRIVLGTLCAALLGGVTVWAGLSALAKNQAGAAHAAEYKRWMTSVETSPQWKARAAAFNLHKKTAAAIFAGATRVQVFRVAQSDTETPKGTLAEIKKFGSDPLPYYAQGGDQTHNFAARLGAIILDPRNYPFPGQDTKQCIIEPGVDFRVWKNARFVDVLICFRCNQMAVLEYTRGVPMTEIGGVIQARSYVGGDIDAVRPQLLALTKAAMPEDWFMQDLK